MTLYKGLGFVLTAMGVLLFALYPLFIFAGVSPFDMPAVIGKEVNPYPQLVHYLVACLGMAYTVWGLSLLNKDKSVIKPTGIGFFMNIVVHVLALMFAGTIAQAIGVNHAIIKGLFVLELGFSIMMIASMQRKGDA